MLRTLFARLTDRPKRAAALFDRIVAEARQPHWYVAGEVPDTVEGRFAMLATVTALVMVRLDRGGEAARSLSVALTERFIETIDAELRQMGVGDPALGKQVRKLVRALEHRLALFRASVETGQGWNKAVMRSAYRGHAPTDEALRHSEAKLEQLWQSLDESSDEAGMQGEWG